MLDFRRLIKPLIALLKPSSGGKWTISHTQTLNEIMEHVYSRVQLGLFSSAEVVKIHVDADSSDCSAVVVQGDLDSYRVVSMLGRALTVTEASCGYLERLLICAIGALQRICAAVVNVPGIEIVLPTAAEAACMGEKELPLRLQARLIALSVYNCTFASGEGAWSI